MTDLSTDQQKNSFTFFFQGKDNLSCYTYNTHQAKHFFCKTCGIHSFYTPRTSPDACGISPYCLDEGTVTKMDIIPCDAKNWEKWQQYLKENPKAADCTENTSQTDSAVGTLHHRHDLTPVSNVCKVAPIYSGTLIITKCQGAGKMCSP